VLAPGWREAVPPGQPRHDLALLVLKEAIGHAAGGWLALPGGAIRTANSTAGAALGAAAASGPAALGRALGGSSLSVVGYPDDRANGSMWTEPSCQPVRWGFDGMLWHGCATRGGNSGSPLFVVARGAAAHGGAVAVAVHVASRHVPRRSDLGRALEAELRATGLAPELAAVGGHGSAEGEGELLVVPLAVPLAGETLAWLRAEVARQGCEG
jgi:hypothetical protein